MGLANVERRSRLSGKALDRRNTRMLRETVLSTQGDGTSGDGTSEGTR
jgi:hypothetical protein